MKDKPRPLTICLLDMNDGYPNQAMRCIGVLLRRFEALVHAKNPGLPFCVKHVSPRDLGHLPPRDADLYLSTGGPGSPYDGDGTPWYREYCRFLDDVAETAAAIPDRAPSLFAVCYSFEIAVRHFEIAKLGRRATTKLGVMPVYVTSEGRKHPLTSAFTTGFLPLRTATGRCTTWTSPS